MSYIDQEIVFEETNKGYDIFAYYFHGVDFNNPQHRVKDRGEEKTASARVAFYKGQWRITDFGNQNEVNSMNSISYVMRTEGLQFPDALKFIEQVIVRKDLSGGDFKKPKYKADYSFREMQPEDVKGDYSWNFKERSEINEADCRYFGRYVTPALLEKFNCRVVKSYEYCGTSKKMNRDVVHQYAATEDFPIFLFDYGDFKKLYRPMEVEKRYRFLYIGEKPKNYIYGLKQLKDAKNELVDEKGESTYKGPDHKKPHIKDLFRCSGESDALNVASLGFHVYWLNSESANYADGQYKQLDYMCENHYQIMDRDATGRAQAIKMGLKYINIFTLELPKWIETKKDWRGNPCKDAKDFVNVAGKNQEETSRKFTVLKANAKPMKFWTKSQDKNGNDTYNINLEYYYFFLQANGFYVMDSQYHKKAGYCYARVNGKTVELIHPDDIKKITKRFSKEWIRSRYLMDENAILNKINSSNQISENNLQELAEIAPEFNNFNSKFDTICYRNGALKITKDEITRIDHRDLPNYILGKLTVNKKDISHINDRSIRLLKKPPIEVEETGEYKKLIDELRQTTDQDKREELNIKISQIEESERYKVTINDKENIFIRFLKDISHIYWKKELELKKGLTEQEKKEQDLLLANILFTLGYMCAQYKDPAKPWMVFLQDLKISEVGKSSGRSGKSLLTMAINKVRPCYYIGGRNKKLTENQFIYDGFTKFHQAIEVDDLHEYAEMDFFYTQVTGKREVNNKHLSPETLEYKDSGKMLISSNFELRNTDNSTLARMLFSGVSDYYHESTKQNDYKQTVNPAMKFGKRLFDDFTDEEWVVFDNIIAYAIQMTMRFEKINPPMGNLDKRQLRRKMTEGLRSKDEEFFYWASGYFQLYKGDNKPTISPEGIGYYNTLINKETAFEDFKRGLSSKQREEYKKTQFKKAIMAFCDYHDFEFNPLGACNDKVHRRITKTTEGTTREYFYIFTGAEVSIPKDEKLTEAEQASMAF
ncbi:hypothetical protein DF185_19800 [Marinifilum breve]|uniref:Uncharacterized protein n=1 Tax=Marinifilum breve TaxID=2184082 RepID=A0A2V3ZWE1_9BACT|nr:hypothetical protein [Marinifilum breve]PXX96886.1 hypothetical protein DF185_19800 [Marinifilum breve]